MIFVRPNTPNVCVFVPLVIIKIVADELSREVSRTRARQRTAADAPPWHVAIATTGPRRRRRTVRPSRCGRRRKPPSTASVSHFILYNACEYVSPSISVLSFRLPFHFGAVKFYGAIRPGIPRNDRKTRDSSQFRLDDVREDPHKRTLSPAEAVAVMCLYVCACVCVMRACVRACGVRTRVGASTCAPFMH